MAMLVLSSRGALHNLRVNRTAGKLRLGGRLRAMFGSALGR